MGLPASFLSLFRTSLSLSIKTDPFCLSYSLLRRLTNCDSIQPCSSAFHRDLWLIESKVCVEPTVEIHIWTPHSWHFCSANFEPRQMVQRFGRIVENLPGPLVAHGRVLGIVYCTGASRTTCTMLVEYILGGNFQPPPRHSSCVSL